MACSGEGGRATGQAGRGHHPPLPLLAPCPRLWLACPETIGVGCPSPPVVLCHGGLGGLDLPTLICPQFCQAPRMTRAAPGCPSPPRPMEVHGRRRFQVPRPRVLCVLRKTKRTLSCLQSEGLGRGTSSEDDSLAPRGSPQTPGDPAHSCLLSVSSVDPVSPRRGLAVMCCFPKQRPESIFPPQRRHPWPEGCTSSPNLFPSPWPHCPGCPYEGEAVHSPSLRPAGALAWRALPVGFSLASLPWGRV